MPKGPSPGATLTQTASATVLCALHSAPLRPLDAPGAGTSAGQGTFPLLNNPEGAITGYEIDSAGVYHGFLRSSIGH